MIQRGILIETFRFSLVSVRGVIMKREIWRSTVENMNREVSESSYVYFLCLYYGENSVKRKIKLWISLIDL